MLQSLHARLDPLGAVHKKMFGGVCFMLNGHMLGGTSKRGLLVRTGKEFDSLAVGRADCAVMNMTGRDMAGFWQVDGDIDEEAFEFWMQAALAYNKTLKPK
jgi:TfoX/Sxy family transcriptional regulator of competence genes